MKAILIILTAYFSINTSFSQNEIREVTKGDSINFEKSIHLSVDSLRQVLSIHDYLNDSDKKLTIEFQLDTFKVEKRLELYLNQDYSDYGMKIATINQLNDYEKLLNKYYKKLLAELKPEDKETLKIAQRNWIKYREAEYNLNNLVSQDSYSGGGTIQTLFTISRNMEITKARVIEFYEYLGRIAMNE